MKRNILVYLFSRVLLPLMLIAVPFSAGAGRLPIPPLPPLIIPVPPPVVLIPGTYVYVAPDVNADLVFYHGYWYRPYRGHWYRSSRYNGPWGFVPGNKVPRPLISLPPGFRNVSPGHERIPYGHLKKNWRTWERERHWDRSRRGERREKRRHEREEYGRERGNGHGRGHGR